MSKRTRVTTNGANVEDDYMRKDGYVGTPHSRSSKPPRTTVLVQRPDSGSSRPVTQSPRSTTSSDRKPPKDRP